MASLAGASGQGRRGRIRAANQARAATMKALGIERTTGRCANCHRIITIESRKSRYTHICH